MSERRIEYVPLDDVQPAARNPKQHNLPALARSMERFGYVEPIVIDERTGKLVAGHGRVEELQRRRADGDDAPDGVRVMKNGSWRVPVIRGWASNSDAEAEAYLLASNRLSELGGWDDQELLAMLDGMDQAIRDVTGFDSEALDELVARMQEINFNPTQSYGGADEAHAEPSYGERAARYAGKDVRSFILDFSLAEFAELSALAAKLRSALEVDNTATLFARLLREAVANL